MAHFTVFGGRGFIGQEIVKQLHELHHEVWVPERDDPNIFEKNLGIVIYCAGNGDCQKTPFDVFNANTMLLVKVLQFSVFERLVYVSSTRVYMNWVSGSEDSDVLINIDDGRRLFNLTKLVAEELCSKSGKKVIIVRPSNVYGIALNSPLFLPSITRNAINNKHVDMFISRHYAKDYVLVSDVAYACIKLSDRDDAIGQIYNVAAGANTTAEEIADIITTKTGCTVTWHSLSQNKEIFPTTDISKLRSIIPDYQPSSVLKDLSDIIEQFKVEMSKKDEPYS